MIPLPQLGFELSNLPFRFVFKLSNFPTISSKHPPPSSTTPPHTQKKGADANKKHTSFCCSSPSPKKKVKKVRTPSVTDSVLLHGCQLQHGFSIHPTAIRCFVQGFHEAHEQIGTAQGFLLPFAAIVLTGRNR